MGLNLFLLQYRRMVLAIWGGYGLPGWRDITAGLGLGGDEGSGEDGGGSWLGLGRLVGV